MGKKEQKISRANKACSYFPCHEGLEDCTFCYCPFYPCEIEERGGYWLKTKKGKIVWSCEKCIYPHIKENVDRVYNKLKEGVNNFG